MTLALHSSSPDDTRAIAAALAPLVRPRDLIVLAGEMGAGKTAFAQGLALGLGVDDPVTSPTFTLVRTYEGRLPVHHVDVYRLERLVEVHDLGLSELLDGDGAVVIEWGDVVTAALAGRLRRGVDVVLSERGRTIAGRASGRSWLVDAVSVRRRCPGGVAMLILGIEIGDAAGRLRDRRSRRRARARSTRYGAGATPRRSRPLSTLSAARRRSSSTRSACVAVDIGPGLFTGLRVGVATAKALAQALRVPMIGVPSLDLLAFPLRYTQPAHRGRDRRPARRGLLRVLPPGARRRAARLAVPASARPTTSPPSSRPPATSVLLVGDGALRYHEAFADADVGSSSREQRLSHPSAAPLVRARPRPRPARGVRVNPWELEPLYLRKPDAEINWADPAGSRAVSAWRARPAIPMIWSYGSCPCAAATSAPCCASRRRCTRAVVAGLFMCELRQRDTRVLRRRPRRCGRSSATAALMIGGRRRPRHHFAVDPDGTGTRSAPVARRARGRASPAAPPASRSRCASSNTAAQDLYRTFGFAPAGVRKSYYAETDRGRPRHVGARRRQARVRRATRVDRGGLPGTTVVERQCSNERPMSQPAGPDSVISGIETSCDETAAAVVGRRHDVLSSVVSSQVDLHARFGGVVPEIASRAHVELLTPVVAEALVEAGRRRPATSTPSPPPSGPGLVGSLLVGVSAAKALALVWDVPFVGGEPPRGPPLRGVPRGARPRAAARRAARLGRPHAARARWRTTAATGCSAQTIDDAAGEAFDKVARFLGLGYPGGPAIDRLADGRRPDGDRLPAGDARRRATTSRSAG